MSDYGSATVSRMGSVINFGDISELESIAPSSARKLDALTTKIEILSTRMRTHDDMFGSAAPSAHNTARGSHLKPPRAKGTFLTEVEPTGPPPNTVEAVKFVYNAGGPSPLPFDVQTPTVLEKIRDIMNEDNFVPRDSDGKAHPLSEKTMVVWERVFCSDECSQFFEDYFWWTYCNNFQKEEWNQDLMFSRMADRYVRMFMAIEKEHKDTVLALLSLAIAKAISAAFHTCFYRSTTLFDNTFFRNELMTRLVLWSTGVKPKHVDDWKPVKVPLPVPGPSSHLGDPFEKKAAGAYDLSRRASTVSFASKSGSMTRENSQIFPPLQKALEAAAASMAAKKEQDTSPSTASGSRFTSARPNPFVSSEPYAPPRVVIREKLLPINQRSLEYVMAERKRRREVKKEREEREAAKKAAMASMSATLVLPTISTVSSSLDVLAPKPSTTKVSETSEPSTAADRRKKKEDRGDARLQELLDIEMKEHRTRNLVMDRDSHSQTVYRRTGVRVQSDRESTEATRKSATMFKDMLSTQISTFSLAGRHHDEEQPRRRKRRALKFVRPKTPRNVQTETLLPLPLAVRQEFNATGVCPFMQRYLDDHQVRAPAKQTVLTTYAAPWSKELVNEAVKQNHTFFGIRWGAKWRTEERMHAYAELRADIMNEIDMKHEAEQDEIEKLDSEEGMVVSRRSRIHAKSDEIAAYAVGWMVDDADKKDMFDSSHHPRTTRSP